MSNHVFVTEFIEIYRMHSCLWNKKDPHYHNNRKREAAYNILLKKCEEYDVNATMAMVKRKINSLRSAYKKELNKVKESTKSRIGTSEIYEPSLWYFDLFKFLEDQQDVRGLTLDNTIDDEDEEDFEDGNYPQVNVPHNLLDEEDDIGEESTYLSSSSESIPRENENRENETSQSPRFKRKSSFKYISNKKPLRLLTDKLTKNKATTEGEYATFGSYVAAELRNMPSEMIPFVKKIINDAIFEGHMKSLNKTSSIKTDAIEQGPCWPPQQLYETGSTQPQRNFLKNEYTPTRSPIANAEIS